MSVRDADHPLTSAISGVIADVTYLLQTEIRLAKAELGEKASRAANGAAFVGIGAVLVLPGLFILLLAIVRWLEVAGIPDQWGLLVVGLAVVGGGILLALRGIDNLKARALLPERTIDQVRADYSVVKEQVK